MFIWSRKLHIIVRGFITWCLDLQEAAVCRVYERPELCGFWNSAAEANTDCLLRTTKLGKILQSEQKGHDAFTDVKKIHRYYIQINFWKDPIPFCMQRWCWIVSDCTVWSWGIGSTVYPASVPLKQPQEAGDPTCPCYLEAERTFLIKTLS